MQRLSVEGAHLCSTRDLRWPLADAKQPPATPRGTHHFSLRTHTHTHTHTGEGEMGGRHTKKNQTRVLTWADVRCPSCANPTVRHTHTHTHTHHWLPSQRLCQRLFRLCPHFPHLHHPPLHTPSNRPPPHLTHVLVLAGEVWNGCKMSSHQWTERRDQHDARQGEKLLLPWQRWWRMWLHVCLLPRGSHSLLPRGEDGNESEEGDRKCGTCEGGSECEEG